MQVQVVNTNERLKLNEETCGCCEEGGRNHVVSLAGAVHYCKTMLEMTQYLLWLFGKVLNRMEDGDGFEDLEINLF